MDPALFFGLQRLARAGLLQPVRARKRGYVFTGPPEEIALLERFETIEGQPRLDLDDCPRGPDAPIGTTGDGVPGRSSLPVSHSGNRTGTILFFGRLTNPAQAGQ